MHGFFARWLADDDLLFHHVATFWAERDEPNLLLVHYNDLKADLDGEMRRVAAFLGVDVTGARGPTSSSAAPSRRCKARPTSRRRST